MNVDPLFDVTDRVVLVTGGSRGIGEMIAQAFVARGADVIINARNHEACEQAATKLRESGKCRALPGDLSTLAGIDTVASKMRDMTSTLDILINNAGATWGAPLVDFPETGWSKTFDVNLKAPFFLIQRLLPLLLGSAASGDPSRIINIASIDGLRAPEFESYAYAASKAGMLMLTKHLATRLAKDNILVNAIAPGFFRTKMTDAILDRDEGSGIEKLPLRRVGSADEIGGTAIFLASRAAGYMTGTTTVCDGGASLG